MEGFYAKTPNAAKYPEANGAVPGLDRNDINPITATADSARIARVSKTNS